MTHLFAKKNDLAREKDAKRALRVGVVRRRKEKLQRDVAETKKEGKIIN